MPRGAIYDTEDIRREPPQRGTDARARDTALFDANVRSTLPDWLTASMNDRQKAKYIQRFRKPGGGRLGQQLGVAAAQRDQFGYGAQEDALGNYLTGEFGAAQREGQPTEARLNLRREQSPTLTATGDYAQARLGGPTLTEGESPVLAKLAAYAKERLGSGLTPQEISALRAPQIEAVEGAAREGQRTLANRLASQGMTSGGLAETEAGRLERARMGGRAGIERDLVTRALQRKGEIEALNAQVGGQELQRRGALEELARGVGGQEEAAREFDVGTTTARLGDLERMRAALAAMGEGRREYDLGFGEAKRQSKISRRLMRDALRRANPSTLERVSSILGGVVGGLGGG